MEIKDQLHRKIQLKHTPKRIVSLVPSQTELLFDLGLEDSIVGITKFCVHPKHAIKSKMIVGGTKQIHIEKIKALQPDIILCNKEENTKELVEACGAICPVHVSDIITINDCWDMMTQYGELFEKTSEAKEIIKSIQVEYSDYLEFVKDKPVLKTAYFIWKNPWMVVGKDTFINNILELNRFENAYPNLNRYPEIDINNLPANIDLILLSSEPFPFKEKHIEELEAYYPLASIQIVDGELFSWYGSRLLKSFKYFKNLREQLL